MLSLYRRHRQNCKGNHAHNSRTTEYDERKHGWKKCECPIFASGTLQGIFKRQNTAQWDWNAARAVTIAYEKASSWTGTPTEPIPVAAIPEPPSSKRTTIERAIKTYLDEFGEHAA